jgi:hypothetical protein
MRKSLLSPIADMAPLAGGGDLAIAQQMGSPVSTNHETQGYSRHQPGAMQRPAEGRSTVEQKERRLGQSGTMESPAQGRSAASQKAHRSGRSGAMQGRAEGWSSVELSKGGMTEQRSATSSKLSPNQKTELRGLVTDGDVRSVDHVNFSRLVGTRGRRTADLHDLPETIVKVVPQFRGFKYIVVQGELIIVDPGTRHRSRSSGLTSA